MNTTVQFLLEKDSPNEVFAYFPFLKHDSQGNRVSYSHIDQHSACAAEYAAECKEATPEQYQALKSELEGLGYELQVVNGDIHITFDVIIFEALEELPEEDAPEEITEEETPGDIFEA